MFDRPQSGERAILVQLTLPGMDAESALAEFKELAHSAQAIIQTCIVGSRAIPEARYYVGLGKAEEIQEAVALYEAELVLINHELSPSQERNLERLLKCRVVDRSGLILDIFAQRARTFEGKLQVELAQLQHLSTRVVRGWTHLERQKGGIGLRGPGETQLETDRRLLRERIKFIHKRLDKIRQSREQSRLARKKNAMPTVSLVGYTNAGKSTLFNALTGETLFAANQLFATLDPTMRKLSLSGATSVILTDTVGFLQQLPHQLIEAFRATLEETKQADLLLHVIDVSDPHWREKLLAVEEVLQQLEITDIPIIQVFNKIDQQKNWQAKLDYSPEHCNVWVSAKANLGMDLLKDAIALQLQGPFLEEDLFLTVNQASQRAALYAIGAVLEDKVCEDGWQLKIRLTEAQKKRLF